MEAKDKAKEIVVKLLEFNQMVKWDSDNDEWIHNYNNAKECALILVDEILEEIDWHITDIPHNQISYWQEVKQEILKL
jgi:hypothetical protein